MNYIIIDELKKIIAWTPKCGCTSVKHQILLDLNISIKNESIHSFFMKTFHINKPISKNQENYKFELYVRDPYHRILSCFLNRVVINDKLNSNINFKDFVYNIDFYSNQSLDIKQHTRPQYLNYFDAPWNVYDISKFRFSHNTIYNKTNHSRGFLENAWSISKKNLFSNESTYSKDSFYHSSILEKIKTYYKNDYDLLEKFKIDVLN